MKQLELPTYNLRGFDMGEDYERNFQVLVRRLSKAKHAKGAEIGCDKGHTTSYLLNKLEGLTSLLAVDLWDAYEGSDYFTEKGKAKHAKKIFDENTEGFDEILKVRQMASVEASKKVRGKTLDFVFIDANHTYPFVKEDIAAWLPKVKKTGIICGHDYVNEPYAEGVVKAVDEAFGDLVETDNDTMWFVDLKKYYKKLAESKED